MKEAMNNIQHQMHSVHAKIHSDAKLKQGLKTLKENMKILRERILSIQSKLSVAQESPYLSLEERERLEKVYQATNQPTEVPGKIETVKGKLEDLLEARTTLNPHPCVPGEALKIMSNEERRRVI